MNFLLAGLPPVVGDDPRVLILGSFPSVESLRQQQYYAHARNHFWVIMSELLGVRRELPYAQRLAALRRRHIALWDVIHRCRRDGSRDQDIVDETVNDFARLFAMHPQITRVFFNGTKAEATFRRLVAKRAVPPALAARLQQVQLVRLPSTSPLNARLTAREKVKQWRVVVAR